MPPSAFTPSIAAVKAAFCSSGVAMPKTLLATGPTMFVRPNASFSVLPLAPVVLPVGQPDCVAAGAAPAPAAGVTEPPCVAPPELVAPPVGTVAPPAPGAVAPAPG